MTATIVDWTTTRADRHELRSCTYCHGGPGEPARPEFCHVGGRWNFGITQPGTTLRRDASTGGERVALTTRCSPTIEQINDPVACTLYRPACLGAGCGWVGDETTVENLAVAEVHDHSHPRWRELPVIARAPHDMDTARRDVWRLEVNRIYNGLDQPALLLLPGGVIRNARHPSGTRSHWTHQVDGYDIRARVNTCLPPPCAAELPTLI